MPTKTVHSIKTKTISPAENTFSKENYAHRDVDILGRPSKPSLNREEHVWHTSKATSFHIDKTEWDWKTRRLNLLKSILERWKESAPAAWLKEDVEITEEDIFCQRCYISLKEYDGSFHVHHMYEEDGNGTAKGGWQHLFKLEDEFMANVPLLVTCKACHAAWHERKLWEDMDIE